MFTSLIEAFKKVQSAQKRNEETFLEICGYPHYENVISNVLAFFFDDKNNHNLNGLLSKSFIEACGIRHTNLDFQFQVEREVRTDAGGFIDILLTNESCCIVIENKVFGVLNNDLNDYIKHAKKKNSEKTMGIVLSMYRLDPQCQDFVNITYSNFLDKIRSNLGHFIGSRSNQFLFLLMDLVTNIENLYKGGITMNSEFINFIRNNHESVQRIGAELKNFHDDLRKTVKQVNAQIVMQIQDPSVDQWSWRELPELYDVAGTDFHLRNEVGLAIDSIIDPNKWEFQVYVRKNPGIEFSILDYCMERGLTGNIDGDRFVLDEKLPMETKPTEVANKIVGLITTLKD